MYCIYLISWLHYIKSLLFLKVIFKLWVAPRSKHRDQTIISGCRLEEFKDKPSF